MLQRPGSDIHFAPGIVLAPCGSDAVRSGLNLNVTRQNTLLIALVACAFLQADLEARQAVGTTTGAISGKVTDSSGAVLPGVRITSSSDAVIGNGGTRATVTAGNGLYRFPALPPSEYSLLFVLGGFRTSSREGIHVGVGFTATVNVVLEVAAVNESVNVERRSPVIDTQSTAITTGFDVLTNLPGSRSLFAILTATPAVQVERFEVGGSSGDSGPPYSAYGTRAANRPMVEGINVAGIFPSGFTLDYGSFNEVSVGTAVHGAEWPLPGVQMQIISKPESERDYGNVPWLRRNDHRSRESGRTAEPRRDVERARPLRLPRHHHCDRPPGQLGYEPRWQ
jgi:hypothetical protein